MKVGFLYPNNLPISSQVYLEKITGELAKMGHIMIPFSGNELPTPADIYWQPSAGRNGPNVVFKTAQAPVVVTFHGAANLVLSLRDCFKAGFRNRLAGYKSRLTTYYEWRLRYRLCAAIIAVSDYAKKEAESYLGLPESLITRIYYGMGHETFYPTVLGTKAEPYLLHISSYQPKKNLERIIAGYFQLSNQSKPRLIIVSPWYGPAGQFEGIELIREPMNHQQIAALYQDALGFIFPSLHETFGMPIIEAMACGCPVITSNHPGCVEVAGDAALFVDPYSVSEIAGAMQKLIADHDLRKQLRNKGVERARQFSWTKSAQEHLAVFRRVLRTSKN
jgi:glycosyltransferase involved in cell wall biosynthesis